MQNSLATPGNFPSAAVSAAAGARARTLSLGAFLAVAAGVCAVLWAAVWAYIVFFPMAYLDRDYPLTLAKAQLAAACPADDIAVFGDSRAMAGIVPAAMDIRVTNLASPGASPIENYFLVRRLLRCPTPPKLVVLAQSAALYDGPHAFWNIYAHMGILTQSELREVTAAAARLHDPSLRAMPHPRGVPYALLPALYGMRFPPLYFASLIGGYGFVRGGYNRTVLHDIVHDSGHLLLGDAPGSDGVSDEGSMPDWQVTPVTDEYMRRTLALLASRHVPVAIVTMPVNQATCDRMAPSLQTRLSAYLESVTRGNPDVVLADAAIACWPDRDFNDEAHFNARGAALYTAQFQAEIKQAVNSANDRTALDE